MVCERTNFYGHIMMHLSDKMKLGLSSFTGVRDPDTGVWTIPDWASISDETNVNPLLLWRAIVYVHSHPDSGSSRQSKKEANRVFTNLVQGSGESDSDFKKNFDAILLGNEALGIPLPRDKDQALLFISKLDSERHESLMHATKNAELLNNADVPASLAIAYHRLTNWSTGKKKSVAPAVSTVEHSDGDPDPKPSPMPTPMPSPSPMPQFMRRELNYTARDNRKTGRGGRGYPGDFNSGVIKPRTPSKFCTGCDCIPEDGHLWKNCPDYLEAKAIVAERKKNQPKKERMYYATDNMRDEYCCHHVVL